ncbi:MAG: Cell division protein FtsB [Fibrobacteres bacterium]|nr:Cell division protein FtsB [Fibrobacterota bacterium]
MSVLALSVTETEQGTARASLLRAPMPSGPCRSGPGKVQGIPGPRPLTGRWEPTRENVMMVLRKSYLSPSEAAQAMGKTSAPKTVPKKRVRWLRYAILGMLGMGVYHILSGPSGAINLFKLRKTNARLGEELDSLAMRKQALEIEKQRLEKDSAYIERVARKELGMAKPEEKVFRFVPPPSKGKSE